MNHTPHYELYHHIPAPSLTHVYAFEKVMQAES